MDFKNNANLATEYLYDKNGDLIKDYNKSITEISYNALNLPQALKNSSVTNTYTYAADRRKLKTTYIIFTWRVIWVLIVWLPVLVLFWVVTIIRSNADYIDISHGGIKSLSWNLSANERRGVGYEMDSKYASYFLLAYRDDIGMGAGVATDNDKNKGCSIQYLTDKI